MYNFCTTYFVHVYKIYFSAYICGMKKTTTVSVREAWAHFIEHVKPEIWATLDSRQKVRIDNADRDFHGKRIRRNGAAHMLSADRIKAILSDLAPGRYQFIEQVEIC